MSDVTCSKMFKFMLILVNFNNYVLFKTFQKFNFIYKLKVSLSKENHNECKEQAVMKSKMNRRYEKLDSLN